MAHPAVAPKKTHFFWLSSPGDAPVMVSTSAFPSVFSMERAPIWSATSCAGVWFCLLTKKMELHTEVTTSMENRANQLVASFDITSESTTLKKWVNGNKAMEVLEKKCFSNGFFRKKAWLSGTRWAPTTSKWGENPTDITVDKLHAISDVTTFNVTRSIQQLKGRWHSSYLLIYKDLLNKKLSFGVCAIYFDLKVYISIGQSPFGGPQKKATKKRLLRLDKTQTSWPVEMWRFTVCHVVGEFRFSEAFFAIKPARLGGPFLARL